MRFPVVLHTDDGVRYGVTVPDLPGCFSAGDTFDQALECVVEAIELHLEGLTEDGSSVPVPRPVADHLPNPDYTDGVWAAVDVDVSRFDGRAGQKRIADLLALPGAESIELEIPSLRDVARSADLS